MKEILFLFLLLLVVETRSQTTDMMRVKTEGYNKEILELKQGHLGKRKKGIGNALLNFYQKRVSVLISADCVYQLSCSRFSREAINKKGLIAGVLLSADRLSRCSYPCTKDIPFYKFNSEGLAEDNP